ncbi:MAG: PilZ domain-containing protein [Syntrophobacterales bacterium]|jgi:hypothetical protein
MGYGSERRRHPRAEIEWPTTIRQDGLFLEGITKNLSHSGALICCDHKLLPGERIRIAIMLADRLPLVVDAEVARSSTVSSDFKSGLFEIGVHFIAISDEDLRLIDLAVSEQLRSTGKDWAKRKSQENDPVASNFVERRRFPRVSADWPVTIDSPQGFVRGRTVDISAGGAFISCKQPMKRSEKFLMAFFNVPTLDRALSVRAEVVRTDFYWADDETLSYGIGVKFIDISEEDKELVSTLVSHLFKSISSDMKDSETAITVHS